MPVLWSPLWEQKRQFWEQRPGFALMIEAGHDRIGELEADLVRQRHEVEDIGAVHFGQRERLVAGQGSAVENLVGVFNCRMQSGTHISTPKINAITVLAC